MLLNEMYSLQNHVYDLLGVICTNIGALDASVPVLPPTPHYCTIGGQQKMAQVLGLLLHMWETHPLANFPNAYNG